MTGPMGLAAIALGALAGTWIALKALCRREERIRQQQWWRSWQRERMRGGVDSDE